jgi:hypothetical protein
MLGISPSLNKSLSQTLAYRGKKMFSHTLPLPGGSGGPVVLAAGGPPPSIPHLAIAETCRMLVATRMALARLLLFPSLQRCPLSKLCRGGATLPSSSKFGGLVARSGDAVAGSGSSAGLDGLHRQRGGGVVICSSCGAVVCRSHGAEVGGGARGARAERWWRCDPRGCSGTEVGSGGWGLDGVQLCICFSAPGVVSSLSPLVCLSAARW